MHIRNSLFTSQFNCPHKRSWKLKLYLDGLIIPLMLFKIDNFFLLPGKILNFPKKAFSNFVRTWHTVRKSYLSWGHSCKTMKHGEDITSVMLKMKLGIVGNALLPTWMKASTLRSWNRTSTFGNSKSTLQKYIERKTSHCRSSSTKANKIKEKKETNGVKQGIKWGFQFLTHNACNANIANKPKK